METVAERKKRKREAKLQRLARVEILDEIERLNLKRCDKCRDTSASGSNLCGCAADKRIKELGKALSRDKVAVTAMKKREELEKVSKIHEKTFKERLTVEKYEEMKKQKMSDAAICSKIGWHIPGLTDWKHKHGLVRGQQPKEAVSKPKEIDIQSNYDQLLRNYNNLVDESSEKVAKVEEEKRKQADHIEYLEKQVQNQVNEVERLKESNQYFREENYGLAIQRDDYYNKFSVLDSDYRKLEVDFLNGESEIKRLGEMLEKLKDTMQMNVWLMKQHVGFVEQLDERVGESGQSWLG